MRTSLGWEIVMLPGLTLIVFANLLRLFLKKGSTVPNRYGGAPKAFSFAA